MKIHNRWFQLVASVIAMVMIANLQYAWTLFVEPMRVSTGWKLSEIQWAFTLFILFQTWVQPAQGFLIDRLGPRLFTTVAGVLCGVGWAGLGLVTTLPMLYALYVLAGIGAALVYGGCMGSALKWFTKQRGLAAGIIAAGFGGGTALFVPIIASLIKNQGYRTAFLYTGIFQGVMILIVAQFLRHPPAQPAAAPKVVAAGVSRLGQHQFTTGEMLRTPQFYVPPTRAQWPKRGAFPRPRSRWRRRSTRSPTAAAGFSGAGSRTRPAASWRWASRSRCRRSAWCSC